jgi:hypothetical protein
MADFAKPTAGMNRKVKTPLRNVIGMMTKFETPPSGRIFPTRAQVIILNDAHQRGAQHSNTTIHKVVPQAGPAKDCNREKTPRPTNNPRTMDEPT